MFQNTSNSEGQPGIDLILMRESLAEGRAILNNNRIKKRGFVTTLAVEYKIVSLKLNECPDLWLSFSGV